MMRTLAGETLLAGWILAGLAVTGFGHQAAPGAPDSGAAAADPSDEKGEEEVEEKWDVDNPPGPRFEQTIDTNEGTWMNLDVSPTGDQIAFDLLGDLYLLPLAGGEAEKLTSGISWDMQPRFSPDGRWIAFTSDRTGKSGKGGDNIWVIGTDGEGLRQITDEPFRLLNGPAWSPDGEYIVARKHFTSRRSLGSGEMWMYHRTGVDGGSAGGLQLTTKRTDQKDVNEPIFDPTGRYLYYSEDTTPGDTFEYNKDSSRQIYVIQRLDTQEDRTETYISGAGGACRPTPSPDGKAIAFVRRVDEKTGLHLFDTQSGAVRLIHDGLERDMQEAWAIHGVYPAMAWTPDGKSIVFWARGKLQRIHVHSQEVTEIPFHVQDSRTMTAALRFPQRVGEDEFPVRALRWVAVSPDGQSVVYQALGFLWLRQLPDGYPERLTAQDGSFEFYPSWSRDSQSVVFTTWNDAALGAVCVAPRDGGELRVLTTEPGHYVEPAFSPDGSTVVYRKARGGGLVTPLWSQEPGLYQVPAAGGEAKLITAQGSQPQFGADAGRVFFQSSDFGSDADNRKLRSIGLDGKDEREHFSSSWATDYSVSPDGRWIAFVERYNVHVAPFVQTGRSVAVGPGTKSFPLARASGSAGGYVHFSGDSQRLHWSLADHLYTRELTDCFAFLEGAPEELPEPTTEGVDISFFARHDRPQGQLALVGGKVVTMGPKGILEDGTVLIEGNRIVDVGPRSEIEVPFGVTVINCEGHVVVPGLVDTHAHGSQATHGIIPQQNWINFARLGFGVTTIHDPSNDTDSIFAASELAQTGWVVSPRTFSTGTILYGAAGSYHVDIDKLDDARFHLGRMQAIGAFSVKSYNQPRRDQRQMVLTAAREKSMMVVPEGGSTFMHNLTMIVDGHTGIEHTLPVQNVYDDVIDLWRGTYVGYTPTLSVAYGGISGEYYWYQKDELWKHPRLNQFIPASVLHPRSRRRQMAPEEDYNHIQVARIAKLLIDNEGIAQAGGHGQLAGICTHWELWMLVQGGMTPLEALRCGTLFGARYLGLDNDLGSIEMGKLADVLVYEEGADPTSNIRDSEKIRYTIANGRVYESSTLDELGNAPRRRLPFYFEVDGFSESSLPPEISGCVGCGR